MATEERRKVDAEMHDLLVRVDERQALMGKTIEAIWERLNGLPCSEHARKLEGLTVRTGFIAAIFAGIGSALAWLLTRK